MGRRSKFQISPEEIILRNVLASNLTALLDRDREFSDVRRFPSATSRYIALAARIKTSLSQIQRIMHGTIGTSIDNVAKLAKQFHVEPRDLLDATFRSRGSHSGAEPAGSVEPFRRRGTR